MHHTVAPTHLLSILCNRGPSCVQKKTHACAAEQRLTFSICIYKYIYIACASLRRHSEAKREADCELNCSCFFSPHLSLCRAERPPHLKLEWRGSCPCALQWHSGPHSFSHCLTVFGQQMHPHRGVAAPSLHPQSQHAAPHNSPNKRERRVGPSCASCGPWTFWGTLGKYSCAFELH